MESMEYDSDGEHSEHPKSVSPMQWDGCNKIQPCVYANPAFPSSQTLPSANKNQNNYALYKSVPYSPDSRWNTSRNAFSGFRSSQDPMSPPDVDRSLGKLSDGEDEPCTRRESSKYAIHESLDSSIGTKSSMIEGIPRHSLKYSSTFGGTCHERLESLPGKTSRSQRHSLPVESPYQARSKQLSMDPVNMGYGRSKSVATSDVTQESGNPHADSSSSLRPSKRRKTEPVSQHKQVDVPKKRTLITFKSFLLLNVVIGACLSMYGFKMFLPACGDIGDFDPQKLTKELRLNVYGQHLAVDTIPRLLDKYFSEVNSGQASKSLVISLHGWTGVGKNFVSRIVSHFITFSSITKFVVPLNFPHEAQNDVYAEQIAEWTVMNISQGCVNFVIFDEMDKAGDGVIRGLNDSINILTARNFTATPVVFLLLSNSMGAEINRFVFQKVSSGRNRKSLSYDDLAQVFENSDVVWCKKLESVIDSFVPFLPLEKRHVVQCIKKDMTSKGLDVEEETVNEVIKEMSFFKSNMGTEFSHTGCKRVSDKVNLVRHFQE